MRNLPTEASRAGKETYLILEGFNSWSPILLAPTSILKQTNNSESRKPYQIRSTKKLTARPPRSQENKHSFSKHLPTFSMSTRCCSAWEGQANGDTMTAIIKERPPH